MPTPARTALLCCGAVLLGVCRPGWASDSPIRVLFTVDVESMSDGDPERDIWGRLPGEPAEHGIGRMMDILDRHGVKGTFFVNVYEAPTHGEQAIAEVCRYIHGRGHDLQLHTHPGPMFGVGYMQHADLAKQTEILKAGAELIRKWTGRQVIAHRAGGYMANLDTIRACRQAGIPLEFSYNAAWTGSGLARAGLAHTNAAFVRDDVLCVPVTCYVQASAGSWKSMRFLDIEASSPAEITRVVRQLRDHGVPTAVIMMHSFSFCRGGKVNRRAEAAFDKLLARFKAEPNVRLVSAGQLHRAWQADPNTLAAGDHVPETGWAMTYSRAWLRLDEGWKNIAVAFAPPGLVVLAGAAALVWRRLRRRRAAPC